MAALTQRATSMEARRLAHAGLSLSTFGWAAAFIAGKVALADMTPLSVAVWRYALASTVLLPFALRQRPASGIGPAAAPLAVMGVFRRVLGAVQPRIASGRGASRPRLHQLRSLRARRPRALRPRPCRRPVGAARGRHARRARRHRAHGAPFLGDGRAAVPGRRAHRGR